MPANKRQSRPEPGRPDRSIGRSSISRSQQQGQARQDLDSARALNIFSPRRDLLILAQPKDPTRPSGETTMLDENLARIRAHRNNIHRYRRLLKTRLSQLERQFIERRLAEEQSALDGLTAATFPVGLRASEAPSGAMEMAQ
ncbi:hypothetical protein [Bradyrhizobium yuanmingense]|uniref:hypothetical protein n=2 Tax=Bradyrhizobium TaxID=374 RepID=UPI003A1039C5